MHSSRSLLRFSAVALAVLLFASAFAPKAAAQVKALDVIDNMLAANAKVQTLKITFYKKERLKDSKYTEESSVIKIKLKPWSVYMRQTKPNNGLEVLYVEGTNSGKALVNPNGFPWKSLNLDPLGGLMRDKQHHTIFNNGYWYTVSIIQHLKQKFATKPELLKYGGLFDLYKAKVHKVTMDIPSYQVIDYTVKQGETVDAIAKRLFINPYSIVRLNSKIGDFDSKLSPGQVIKIPSDFARTMVMYVDAATWLPRKFEIYDEAGLYEQYDYMEVQVNPEIKDAEFTKDYSGYNF